jgi:phosphoribosylglycinamide formyltransferase-1
MQALLDAQAAGTLGNAEVVAVVSDRADAYGIQRALGAGLAAACLPLKRPRVSAVRAAWELQLCSLIAVFQPDLVLLSGFMRVLSPLFLNHFPRVINQHPALLPDGGGPTVTTSTGLTIPALRGAHVVADALRLGLTVTGCTVHYVTPAVDDGPVLARAEVPVLPDDTEPSLHERIKAAERQIVLETVRAIATGT